MSFDYDILVIGSGPGGEGAAMQAVKHGRRVAVVERHEWVGGGCTHWGTIPSKALRFSVARLTESLADPLFRESAAMTQINYPNLRARAASVIQRQTSMRQSFHLRNGVDLIRGEASFEGPQRVRIDEEVKTAEKVIIATGSRPYHPPDVDFTHPRIFDSDSILDLAWTPRSLTIYGAGVVGSEYASIFRNLGLKINLVNTREKLLEFLDDEIIDALSYHLRDQGVLIRHREQYERIEGVEDGVIVHLKSGKRLKTDIFLWANGRTGNSDRLNLGAVGLDVDSRGNLQVNESFQTSNPDIYAVGDIIGFPALASAAYMQGRAAASAIIDGSGRRLEVRDIPTGIYTIPEISSIGATERQLTEQQVPYEVGHAQFKSLARAQIMGRTVGVLKILFHRETLEVLGVHCFGTNAAEIIHIGQAIMAQPGEANSLMYFINTTFNYPTMAEAYRVAALNGYNRLF